MKRMFRWAVPIDEQWHKFPISSDPVMAETVIGGERPRVDVWAEKDTIGTGEVWLRVFATGDDVQGKHVVSAPRDPNGGLVFHVYRRR
jgi:hypothetical protein